MTSVASQAYGPPRTVKRADQVKVRRIALPYFKYNRNPHVPLNGPKFPLQDIKPPLPARGSKSSCRRRLIMHTYLVLTIVALVVGEADIARAQEQRRRTLFFRRFHRQKEGTPPPGQPRLIPHTDERAGFPRSLSGHLESSAKAGGIGYASAGAFRLGHGRGPATGATNLGLG